MLKGEKPNAKLIERSANATAKLAKPMDNTDITLGYKKKWTPSLSKKQLTRRL